MERLMETLRRAGFGPDQLLPNEPMARHTTMRVGGPADLIACPSSTHQVLCALSAAREQGIPCMVMGGGSNLIVRDGGVRGLVILLGEHYARIEARENVLVAQAGARLSQLAAQALKGALTGLEFASGIPGTVGGGVAMNAGAYGGELGGVLQWADLLFGDEVRRVPAGEMGLGYRTSRALREGNVVLGAAFCLKPGAPGAIAREMNDLAARRRDKQPLNFPSSGSTFKRPQGYFAGALIEGAGLKGARVGGAQVSEKHAGFVINAGGATARDVLELIEMVRDKVRENSGVTLECEVRVVGEA